MLDFVWGLLDLRLLRPNPARHDFPINLRGPLIIIKSSLLITQARALYSRLLIYSRLSTFNPLLLYLYTYDFYIYILLTFNF
jgi:hypothetical protein